MTDSERTIRLPEPLAQQCEDRIASTEFESVEAYVQFVMAAVVEPDGKDPRTGPNGDDTRAESDEDTRVSSEVEDRLSSLGYR